MLTNDCLLVKIIKIFDLLSLNAYLYLTMHSKLQKHILLFIQKDKEKKHSMTDSIETGNWNSGSHGGTQCDFGFYISASTVEVLAGSLVLAVEQTQFK